MGKNNEIPNSIDINISIDIEISNSIDYQIVLIHIYIYESLLCFAKPVVEILSELLHVPVLTETQLQVA